MLIQLKPHQQINQIASGPVCVLNDAFLLFGKGPYLTKTYSQLFMHLVIFFLSPFESPVTSGMIFMFHGQFVEIQFGCTLSTPLFRHNGNVKWLASPVLSLESVCGGRKKSPAAYILSDCMQLPTSTPICITMLFLRAHSLHRSRKKKSFHHERFSLLSE